MIIGDYYMEDNKEALYLGNVAYFIESFSFLQAHLNVAWLYKEVSVETPIILKNQAVLEGLRSSSKLNYIILTALNVILQAALSIIYVEWTLMNYDSALLGYIFVALNILTTTMLIVYSSIMVISIRNVTKFFKNTGTRLNMWLIQLTKYAFYVLIAASVVLTIVWIPYSINPTEENWQRLDDFDYFLYLAYFVAQGCLCQVMYEFHNREEARKPYDYAVLKAHIWNSFIDPDYDCDFYVMGESVHLGTRVVEERNDYGINETQ
jgi:hypothetical protein